MLPAVEAVFSTQELLETILVEVDMQTLLVSAMRVAPSWRSVIQGSLPLRRALFFHPEPETAAETAAPEPDAPGFTPPTRGKTQNPLLKDIFPAWFENIGGFTPRPRPGVNPMHQFPATAMMGYKRFQELPLYQASLATPDASASASARADKDTDNDDNPFLRGGASWRRMLTSQPPCYTVSTNAKRGPGASMSRSAGRGRVARHGEGLRMGELYDATLRHAARHPVSGFMVIWLGAGEEGYADLARHLRRMSGILPVLPERAVRRLWQMQPDLVVQMLWTEGKPRPREVGVDNLATFWERCGARSVKLDVDDDQ